MSDDNKDLSDELNEMIDDAKESAKRAGEKISQKTSAYSDSAKDFANEAKTQATEFANDAKEVLSEGKNVAIIAHIFLIGWLIALFMNSSNKTELGSFYIRQVLGIMLLGVVLSLIPVLNIFIKTSQVCF